MKTIEELWKKLEKVELVQVRPIEMEAMYKHCFEFNRPAIIEIGSAHGASSIIFAEAARELNGVVICIDHYPENYLDQEKFGDYAKKAFHKNVIEEYNDVVYYLDTYSGAAVHQASHIAHEVRKDIDILFVDGDHSYEGVSSDCHLYLPLLKSGGYVGFHDYNNSAAFPGVKQAADAFCNGWEKESFWDLIIFKKP